MPFRGQVPFDFQSILIKVGFVVGFLIIIYAILWMLAELKLMPVIIFAIFPQIVLLCIGNKPFEIIDITNKINQEIANSGANEGIVNIFSKHSTSAIVVNENETGLLKDLEFTLSNLISDEYSYQHDKIDNNASAHLKSFLL